MGIAEQIFKVRRSEVKVIVYKCVNAVTAEAYIAPV